jgi:hypothetical protein
MCDMGTILCASTGEASPADECSGECDEALVHEQVSIPADGEAFELVQVRDRLLDHPADSTESDDLLAPALRDDRRDPSGVQPLPERGRVVGAIGQDRVRSAAGSTDAPGDRPDGVDQVGGGFDVGDVARGGDDSERDPGPVAGNVVFRARPAAVYG